VFRSSYVLDRYFRISERGSSVPREFRGGPATFFAMAYIHHRARPDHPRRVGFLTFCLLRAAAGRRCEVSAALYVVGAVFAFYCLTLALGLV
jgi:xanthine/uracil/vitamin C permease (AzgA family)